jgi:hypothetical protein
VIDGLLRDFTEFMDGTSLLSFLLIAACIQPVLSLLHELGHGLVAAARVPGQVAITIGGLQPFLTFHVGRITASLHPLMLPWRFDALCRYEKECESRTDAILIALAGPAVSITTGLAAWAILRATPGATMLDAVLGIAAFMSIASAIVCLVPMTVTDTRGQRLRTDGACVLGALR